jgi:drug/metabolite transporter (DMT)-like permease
MLFGPVPPAVRDLRMNMLLLALVPACFALNPVIARAIVEAFGPASLTVIRWSLSALVIGVGAAWLSRQEQWRISARMLVVIAALGALGMGFCSYAAYAAARTSPATNIGLIYGCTSAVVAAWEIAAGRQKSTLVLVAGITACLAGVVLTLTKGDPLALGSLSFTVGDLWAAFGMLGFAFYTVALRRVPSPLTPLAQFTVMSIAATIALVPFAGLEVAAVGWPALHERTLPWLAALVLIAGIGAYLGYSVSVKRNGAVLTAASICLTPVYAAAQAMVLLGEQLGWYHAVALALVVSGLMAINRG